MNSLYGRFGINPESSVTEICSESRYNVLLRKEGFFVSHWERMCFYVPISRVGQE